jgi:hypothetical protein
MSISFTVGLSWPTTVPFFTRRKYGVNDVLPVMVQ